MVILGFQTYSLFVIVSRTCHPEPRRRRGISHSSKASTSFGRSFATLRMTKNPDFCSRFANRFIMLSAHAHVFEDL